MIFIEIVGQSHQENGEENKQTRKCGGKFAHHNHIIVVTCRSVKFRKGNSKNGQ
jgi:hypothetical protein